jgi:hypothetical protein
LPAEKQLPYVHPPFVAFAFRPLTLLPYETAFAAWLLISGSLYLFGLLLARKTLGATILDWPTVFLLALSFEPFIMECWLGGQLSALGFFGYALTLACEGRDRPFGAGLALGLGLYKPTLLVLVVPSLIVARRARMLAGFAVTALALAALSLIGTGTEVCSGFVHRLLGFGRVATSGGGSPEHGGLELPLSKYVDLNSFFRLLLGDRGVLNWLLLAAVALVPAALLFQAWWRYDSEGEAYQKRTWAATLAWTLVLNLYVGVYDSVLVVLATLFAASGLRENDRRGGEAFPCRFRILVFCLYVIPWITQPLARAVGLQPYTLILLAAGAAFLPGRARATAWVEIPRGADGDEDGPFGIREPAG